jgi:hypothetical protein
MAILYMDGFDAADYTQRWNISQEHGSFAPTLGLVTGRFGTGQAVSIKSSGSSQAGGLAHAITASTTFRFGAAVCVTAISPGDFPLLVIPGLGGTVGNITVQGTSMGSIVVRKHSSSYGAWQTISSTIIATSSENYSINQWFYFEVEYTPGSNPNGRVIVRKNGNVIIDFTGDTRSTTAITKSDAIIIAGGYSAGPTVYWDDIYVNDSAGAQNNTFMGDVEVKLLSPNGNGAHSDFVGSDSNSTDNYDLINDATFTDYVESSTVGAKDSYLLENVSNVNVHAVQSVVRGAQAGGGMAAIKPFVRVSGVDYPGSTQYLGQQTVSMNIYEVNPATATVWTDNDINGTEVGVEVV